MNVVVARYKEDISWIYEINNISKIYIYNKYHYNENVDMNLPNIGREAHTYLHHIVANYEHLKNTPDEITFFTQACISDHMIIKSNNISNQQYIDILHENTCTSNLSIITAFNHNFNENSATYDFRISEFPIGTILDREKDDLNFGDWFCTYIRPKFPDIVYWWVNAIFMVKHKNITKNPIEFYKRLLDQFTTQNPEIAHYMERSWFHIFEN